MGWELVAVDRPVHVRRGIHRSPPRVAYLFAADRLREPLERFRLWLIRHNSAILVGVFTVVGLIAVGQGISSLWPG